MKNKYKRIVILGGGPRGLAVAIALANSNFNLDIIVIDNNVLSTWLPPRMVPNMRMRSPISFDLTTYNKSTYKEYSLGNYLGVPNFYTENQRKIEDCTTFCSRESFVRYLDNVVRNLKEKGVKFLKRKVLSINESSIKVLNCSNNIEGTILYDDVIIALGRESNRLNLPSYLPTNNLKFVSHLYTNNYNNKEVNVVGSGQQAAETVEFLLSTKAKVNWIYKKPPKVNQYPIPSMKYWGKRSALGNFYRENLSNKSYSLRAQYLKQVKEWSPTITFDIFDRIRKYSGLRNSNPSNTESINVELDTFCCLGSTPDISLIPFDLEEPIRVFSNNSSFPHIQNNFVSSSHNNIYFTGLLAVPFDGPRQGSIISSSETAISILDHLAFK